MSTPSTICVHNNFASSQTSVTVRSTNCEAATWIQIIFCFRIQQIIWNYSLETSSELSSHCNNPRSLITLSFTADLRNNGSIEVITNHLLYENMRRFWKRKRPDTLFCKSLLDLNDMLNQIRTNCSQICGRSMLCRHYDRVYAQRNARAAVKFVFYCNLKQKSFSLMHKHARSRFQA